MTAAVYSRLTMFAAISIAISLALLAATSAVAAECKVVTFDDAEFTVCEADPQTDTIRLMLDAPDGTKIGTFERLHSTIGDSAQIAFATNGGMYHPDRRPVGLYIENGKEIARIVTRDGPGNFALLPNGVLCLGDGTASIHESRAFAAIPPDCAHATQSGPMLVIDGNLHPSFLPDSSSRFIRNGVGVTPDGYLIAAISNSRVNFHHLARLFRDRLGTPNALFLDGNVSRLLAPSLDRADIGFPLGPMLVVTNPTN